MLINKEREQNTDRTLCKGKRKIEDQKRFKQTVHGGQDRLIHADDDLHRDHDLCVKRIGNKIINWNTRQCRNERTGKSTDHSTRFRANAGIDHACGKYESCADDEICKPTNACRTCEKEVQEIFKQANEDPA